MSDSNISRNENLPVVDLDAPNLPVDSGWGFLDKIVSNLNRHNPRLLYKLLWLAFVFISFALGVIFGRYYFEYIDLKAHFSRFHQDMTDVQEKFLLEQFKQKINNAKTRQSLSK